MSTTVYACGYFSPSQLSVLQSLLDDVTADQDLPAGEREQLARTVISLAKIGVTSEDELRRMLRKATSDLLLGVGTIPAIPVAASFTARRDDFPSTCARRVQQRHDTCSRASSVG